ncbi:MAG: cytochrome c biogenesis protein CcsA [Deltaproteobacteria bacterium]|nr:cytochrome c biogenesis protein CcsA [Deltaproteobacteria bacterium]
MLPFLLFALLSADFYLIFVHAPVEATQGLVQKIFYFHVSSAFAMYAGFLLAGLFAILYLIKKEERWNRLSHAGVSVGLVFCSMVLASGPIWAKPIWGTWWTWDPRLTTTLLIWLIFVAVLLLRKFYGPDPRGKTFASVLTLFGLLDIPLIFFAVKLWRGIHPSVLGQESNMPGEMKLALIFTNVTILILFGVLYWVRYRTLKIEEA